MKKNVRNYLISQSFTVFGSYLVQYALIWYVTLQTQSGVMMSISTICGFLPNILISPYAGFIADHFNRKKVIIISDLAIAIATLLLAIAFMLGYESIYLIFFISIIRSLGTGIHTPASNAMVSQLVDGAELMKFNGFNSVIKYIIMIASPALSGLLLSVFDISYVMMIDVITAMIGCFILFKIPIIKHIPPLEKNSMIVDFKKALSYINTNSLIKKLLIFDFTYFIFVSPLVNLSPLLIARSYGPQEWRLAVLEICFSVGGVLGGIFITKYNNNGYYLKIIAKAALVYSIFTIVAGLPILSFSMFIFICLVLGVTIPLFHVPSNSYIQLNVAKDMMGRVFSVISVTIHTTMPLGMIIFGPLADIFSVQSILIFSGICMLIIALWFNTSAASKEEKSLSN